MTRKTMQAEIRDLKVKNERLTKKLETQKADAIAARAALTIIERIAGETLDLRVQEIYPKISALVKEGLRE